VLNRAVIAQHDNLNAYESLRGLIEAVGAEYDNRVLRALNHFAHAPASREN